jgi:hypothetical protein
MRNLVKLSLKAAGINFDQPFEPCTNSPQLVRQGYGGHDILYYRGTFFGVAESFGPFDPASATIEPDGPIVCSQSLAEVKAVLRRRKNTARSRAAGRRGRAAAAPAGIDRRESRSIADQPHGAAVREVSRTRETCHG